MYIVSRKLYSTCCHVSSEQPRVAEDILVCANSGSAFLKTEITSDEYWVYLHIPETKAQSASVALRNEEQNQNYAHDIRIMHQKPKLLVNSTLKNFSVVFVIQFSKWLRNNDNTPAHSSRFKLDFWVKHGISQFHQTTYRHSYLLFLLVYQTQNATEKSSFASRKEIIKNGKTQLVQLGFREITPAMEKTFGLECGFTRCLN